LSTRKPPSEPSPPPRSEAASIPGEAGNQVTTRERRRLPGPREPIPFQDQATARVILSRVSSTLTPELADSLPGLLTDLPDPDSALMLFDRLLALAPEIPGLLRQHPSLAHYFLVVTGHSHFLGETLFQNSDLLQSFLREKNLDRSFSREEFHEALARFRSRSFETDISLLLARFKRREYVRIMLRDVLKIAPLAETTAEISALADVLIEEALREADSSLLRRYDPPQHLDSQGRLVDTPFAILSLGKLGGSELNYSSDVDLMYIFGDGEAPPRAPVSNREYFIRLAQRVTDILAGMTREGPVFRIDLRLRPQGNEGELAISLSHALQYYATTAHDWERQALIKVRHSAGSAALAREFIRAVQPHVYTEQVNFAAIKTALVTREKMHTRRHARTTLHSGGQTIDIKIDHGGIRDIEFLVQCLQRVYGGAEPWLRSGGTLFSLQKLHDKRHVSGKEFHDLTSAYEFLRHLEHRLQLRQGQQTHRLPTDPVEMRILQRAMEGYVPEENRVADLQELVRRRMAAVAEIYQRVIYQQQARRRHEAPDAPFELHASAELGVAEQSPQYILERLAVDSPSLYRITQQGHLTLPARKNLLRFLSAAFTSSERYAAVLRHPEAFAAAQELFDASEYLTEILIHHPEEVSALADLAAEPLPGSVGCLFDGSLGVERACDPVLTYFVTSAAPYGEKLSLLRRHYRHRVFVAGARDITEKRAVYESLAATTAAAEDAISAAFEIAGRPENLAVMALGRLGSREFDVLSDADVLFVCEEQQDRVALTKSVERIMQALAAYTRDGMVFPVDARLRPRGAEGELLITPSQLAAYCWQEAQPWEALTYTKLRFLAGSHQLAARALQASEALFHRFHADAGFQQSVREMRTKMEAADAPEKSFKIYPGAAYDIDFLTGFLLIRHAVPDKRGSLHDRLWRCAECGLLAKSDAATLDHAAELLRTVEHVARLAVGRAVKWLPATEHARQITQRLSAEILGREFPHGLEAELLRSFAVVREIYERVG
jgi:[glutamine synthetase] adenylyltransferase / [glutamine synthetase]-adenylyl-L-tyrosine phosphorylase